MPTYHYDTATPIELAITLSVGVIDVVATERADTVVTIEPTNPDKAVDRRGAEETKVQLEGGRLTVNGPKPRLSFIGPTESVDVRVELPTSSKLTADLAVGGVRTIGRLDATRVKASTGAIELETVGDLWLRAGHGNATVGRAEGGVEITADHGQVRLGTVTGDAVLKASHGNITVEESGGDLEAKLSYGELEITRALSGVSAKTAYGSIALKEVSSGSIQLESGFGGITIGIRSGVPAWLDLRSKEGRVRNELDGDVAPGESEQSVEVRARTQFGDITIQRAR